MSGWWWNGYYFYNQSLDTTCQSMSELLVANVSVLCTVSNDVVLSRSLGINMHLLIIGHRYAAYFQHLRWNSIGWFGIVYCKQQRMENHRIYHAITRWPSSLYYLHHSPQNHNVFSIRWVSSWLRLLLVYISGLCTRYTGKIVNWIKNGYLVKFCFWWWSREWVAIVYKLRLTQLSSR